MDRPHRIEEAAGENRGMFLVEKRQSGEGFRGELWVVGSRQSGESGRQRDGVTEAGSGDGTEQVDRDSLKGNMVRERRLVDPLQVALRDCTRDATGGDTGQHERFGCAS